MEPQQKLALLASIFRRFFIWVWHAVVLMPLTGYIMLFVFYGGFAGSSPSIHLMQGLSWVMTALFLYMFFGPYGVFRRAVAAEDWAVAGARVAEVSGGSSASTCFSGS